MGFNGRMGEFSIIEWIPMIPSIMEDISDGFMGKLTRHGWVFIATCLFAGSKVLLWFVNQETSQMISWIISWKQGEIVVRSWKKNIFEWWRHMNRTDFNAGRQVFLSFSQIAVGPGVPIGLSENNRVCSTIFNARVLSMVRARFGILMKIPWNHIKPS